MVCYISIHKNQKTNTLNENELLFSVKSREDEMQEDENLFGDIDAGAVSNDNKMPKVDDTATYDCVLHIDNYRIHIGGEENEGHDIKMATVRSHS